MKMNNLTIPAKAHAVVAMSGGVDSSVVAALLLQQGVTVTGITMNHKPTGQEQDIADAKAVCALLGIEHKVVDIQAEYQHFLVNQVQAVYASGQTPNPCVLCNEQMKFGIFFNKFLAMLEDRALADNCFYASGHYARVMQDDEGHYYMAKGVYTEKDQSYFLYRLSQTQLARLRFPLGDLTKPEVRVLAAQFDLGVKSKGDSQDFCLGQEQLRPAQEQPVTLVNEEGEVLGSGKGLSRYTIGMRRGLGVSSNEPLYVVRLDPLNHQVVLGPEAHLYASSFWLDQPCFSRPITGRLDMQVRIRSMSKEQPATVICHEDGRVEVVFSLPQRAITPGQSAVIYEGDLVLGGGFIAPFG